MTSESYDLNKPPFQHQPLPHTSIHALSAFNEYSSQYKCCCGCMHVRTGAIIIGVLELLAVFINVVSYTYGVATGKSMGGQLGTAVASTVITVIIVLCMFWGMKKENQFYIIPHLVLQILAIMVLVIVALLDLIGILVAGTVATTSQDKDVKSTAEVSLAAMIVVIVVLLLSAAFQVWFLIVVLKLYRFYRDKRRFAENASTGNNVAVVQTVQYVTYPPQTAKASEFLETHAC